MMARPALTSRPARCTTRFIRVPQTRACCWTHARRKSVTHDDEDRNIGLCARGMDAGVTSHRALCIKIDGPGDAQPLVDVLVVAEQKTLSNGPTASIDPAREGDEMPAH